MTCTGPKCDRPAVAAGLCGSHYAQKRRGRALSALGLPVGKRGEGERLTVRVASSTVKRLRAEGPPATVARRVLDGWAAKR